MTSAAALRQQALAAERDGHAHLAANLLAKAARAAPRDAALSNSVGSFHTRQGDHSEALRWFERALEIDETSAEAILNRAISLDRLGQGAQAYRDLTLREPVLNSIARYWSIRAALSRSAGNQARAAMEYDRGLALDANQPRALHARARVALDRGEQDAVDRFDRALAVAPNDAWLWLGKAMALDAVGETEAARRHAEMLVARAPSWVEALELLAELRWGSGEHTTFCDHYRSADPADPSVALSRARMLAGGSRPGDAAAILGGARASESDGRALRWAEAAYAGQAGEVVRAGTIIASLTPESAHELTLSARHRIRTKEIEEAERMLSQAIMLDPQDVIAWALRDVVWRTLDDDRAAWLHGQPGLVAELDLGLSDGTLREIIQTLDDLHDRSAPPLGQSVRSGTQTRGALFDRSEPALHTLRLAIEDALARYRAGLPRLDENHPLLAQQRASWRVTRSWSVRLLKGGRHASHVHPQGIVSSAAYLSVPPLDEGQWSGALELGRPPSDLGTDLPPRAIVQPVAGRLVLFPSTLFHGTRSFANGRRLTVAFDIA